MITRFFESFLLRFVDLEQDELKKVLLLQVNIFLIISVLLILKPLSTSLMLNQYGVDIMPLAYGLIAIVALVVHFLIDWLRAKVPLIKAILLNTFSHILILCGLAYLVYMDIVPKWMTILIYVYVNLFALVTVTFFYQYCQSFLSIREAKKVLAYIGIGAIGGGVFGGYFASAVVTISGNVGLLVAAVIFLSISAILMHSIHRMQFGNISTLDVESTEGSTILYTLKNPHVRNVAMIIGLGVVVSKLIDYQFNAIALDNFNTDESLTAFLAFWFSNINLIGFFIQLLLVNYIIDRLGIIKSASIMPSLLVAGIIIMLVSPILSAAIFIKLIDGSLKQSLYKTSTEINIMALSSDLRSKAKTLVDVVIDSIATGISGLIIYGLINKTTLDVRWVGIASLIIALIWLMYIIKSKSSYIKELKDLVVGVRDENQLDEDYANKFLIEHLKGTYRKTNKRKILLIQLLKHDESEVRNAALFQIIDEFGHAILNEIDFMQYDNSFILRKKYFALMLEQINDVKKLNALYSSLQPEGVIILTGALTKSLSAKDNQQQKFDAINRLKQVKVIIEQETSLPKKFYRTFYKAIADARYVPYYSHILDALDHEDKEIKIYALYAIKKSKLKSLFSNVYDLVITPEISNYVHKTIAEFPALLLQNLKKDEKTNWKKLIKRLPALAYVYKQSHLNYAFSLLDHPRTKVRRAALNTIGKFKVNHPTLNFKKRSNKNKLKKELNLAKAIYADIIHLQELQAKTTNDEAYDTLQNIIIRAKKQHLKSLKAIFIYLSIVTERSDIHKIFKSIKTGNQDSALDYLDQILPYNIRKSILPILELILNAEYSKPLMLKNNIRASSKRKLRNRMSLYHQERAHVRNILNQL